MFMFWGKRTSYTKRLLKAKVRGEHETECEAQENLNHIAAVPNSNSNSNINTNANLKQSQSSSKSSSSSSSSSSQLLSSNCCNIKSSSSSGIAGGATVQEDNNYTTVTDLNRVARCKELLKSLKENQLEMLLAAVESYGANLGACVMVKRRRRQTREAAPANDVDNYSSYSDYYFDKKINTETDIRGTFAEGAERRVVQVGERCADTAQAQAQAQAVGEEGERRESLQITSSNKTTANANNYYRQHNHHHPHHHHHHHHSNNHNRRTQRLENNNKKMKERTVAAANAAAAAVAACDEEGMCEENICLEERINNPIYTTATTTITTTNNTNSCCTATAATNTTTNTNTNTNTSNRRSRNSNHLNSNNELPVDPHLLCCQIWRWPDLNNSSELKRLPVCHSAAEDPVDICCNPYHWSRLCKPESPPPPYCLIADRLRPEDRAPSEGRDSVHRHNCRNTSSPPLPGSLTTNGEDCSGQREWCTLAYWELGGRVGRLYPVEPSTINVFDSLLDGDGLCLASLAENHSTSSPSIQRTRSKIGLGLMLSRESDGVWAYNRSDNPIFVNSPTLDDPESRTLLVYRVPPGFCLNIFDRSKALQSSTSTSTLSANGSVCCGQVGGGGGAASLASGPVDVNSVRISFAKGWGPKYSRQEVTSCPCWLEVLLAPCR